MEKHFVIFLLVVNFCLKEISGKEIANLTQEINSDTKSISRKRRFIPKDPEAPEDNEVFSKYYPDDDQRDPYSDYPASYYGAEPLKYFGKPGFQPGYFLGFWKWKLWIATIAKILFKLLIFKKIVKFVILIFLLIFTPSIFSLFTWHGQDNGLFRRFSVEKSKNERINDLAVFVLTGIDSFQSAKECRKREEEFQCRLSRLFKMIDIKYPFRKILKIYRQKLDAEENSPK